MSTPDKVYVRPGQIVWHVMPWSEVCIFMRLADRVCGVELIEHESDGRTYHVAQIYDGAPEAPREFSFPVLPSETGLYHDQGGYYTYAPTPTAKEDAA
jgi:hypothetical protein